MDRIRLIASDMDATLLDENSCLPEDFVPTVRALAGLGIHFAAASGRPLYTDRKSTRLNSSHSRASRMPSSA